MVKLQVLYCTHSVLYTVVQRNTNFITSIQKQLNFTIFTLCEIKIKKCNISTYFYSSLCGFKFCPLFIDLQLRKMFQESTGFLLFNHKHRLCVTVAKKQKMDTIFYQTVECHCVLSITSNLYFSVFNLLDVSNFLVKIF